MSELNKNILVVLTSNKTNARESWEIVEKAGYTISRVAGTRLYAVSNPLTKKRVYIEYSECYRGYAYKLCGTCNNTRRYDVCYRSNGWHGSPFDVIKFDFVGFLEKPANNWRDDYLPESKAQKKYIELSTNYRNAIWNYKYHTNELENERAKLERAVADYERAVAYHNHNIYNSRARLERVNDAIANYKKGV